MNSMASRVSFSGADFVVALEQIAIAGWQPPADGDTSATRAVWEKLSQHYDRWREARTLVSDFHSTIVEALSYQQVRVELLGLIFSNHGVEEDFKFALDRLMEAAFSQHRLATNSSDLSSAIQ